MKVYVRISNDDFKEAPTQAYIIEVPVRSVCEWDMLGVKSRVKIIEMVLVSEAWSNADVPKNFTVMTIQTLNGPVVKID